MYGDANRALALCSFHIICTFHSVCAVWLLFSMAYQRVMFWIGWGYRGTWCACLVAVLFLICCLACMYVCVCESVDKDLVEVGKQKYNDTNVMAKREMNTNVFYFTVFGAFLFAFLLSFFHSSKDEEKNSRTYSLVFILGCFVDFFVLPLFSVQLYLSFSVRFSRRFNTLFLTLRWLCLGFAPERRNIRILAINNQLFHSVFLTASATYQQ